MPVSGCVVLGPSYSRTNKSREEDGYNQRAIGCLVLFVTAKAQLPSEVKYTL